MGAPCPVASTRGSSRASTAIDSSASGRLDVVYHGGPESPGRRKPCSELTLTVTMASPAIRTRSLGQKYDTWPGE
jgi:hypothetical protein